jgi:glycosyltransferase involved in cell wall biosynthesis
MNCNNPLVTVIVPVYKVEPYLRRCLDSIVNQTYRNLEIILIDDGSPDNCGVICDEYAEIDKRIKVIHKKNGGLSSARNVGLDVFKGEYVSFVDSDDVVSLDMIEYLYDLLSDNNAEISVCLHEIVRDNHRWISFKNVNNQTVTPKECIKKLLYNDGVDTSAWAKLYKASLFNNVRYPQGKLFEDIATTYKLFFNANRIALGNEAKYSYILRNSSIVGSSFNEKKLDLLEMTDEMGRNVLNVYPDLSKAVLRRRVYARFSTLNQLARCVDRKKEKNCIIKFIKDNTREILLNNEVCLKDKVASILLNVNYNLYKFIWDKFGKK